MSYVVHYRDINGKRQKKYYPESTTGGHAKNLFIAWNRTENSSKLQLIRVKKSCSGCEEVP